MIHVAIVPARAGSKGVPGKNLKTIGGQTLTHRALNSAIASGIFDAIILTTDIPFFLEEDPKGWIVHERSPELAKDDTPMVDVVMDVIDRRNLPDQVFLWLLQPTSPFRETSHFHQIVEIFRTHSPGSVVGVTHCGDSHPSRHYKISTVQDLVPFLPKVASFDNRQKLKPVYERNGMYYVTRCRDFKARKSFYVPRCRPVEIHEDFSANINNERDYRHAQSDYSYLLSKGLITR